MRHFFAQMSTPQNPVTLATIAAHLGVSRSTVSNAYNHPDQLSPQLRTRILETAAALGYNGPDPVARRLRQRHAGAIGVLFSEPLSNAFADEASVTFLEGIAEAGEKTESGMLLIPARPSFENAHVVQNAIVDGFILYSIPPGHPFVDAALRRRLPVVCVDQTRIGGVSWVGIDDRNAARQAAQHLIDLGHHRVDVLVYGLGPKVSDDEGNRDSDGSGRTAAALDGPCPSVSWLRLEGYADAFRSAGLEWDAVTIHECELNASDAGERVANEIFAKPGRPTALLCTSDALALGAMRAARSHHLDVPSELSVVGFNDLPGAVLADPALTTIRQPLKQKGSIAASLLFDSGNINQTTVDLEFELVVRASTGPA